MLCVGNLHSSGKFVCIYGSAMEKPSRVFTSVLPAPVPELKERPAAEGRTVRELQVKGSAELSVPADRASVRLYVSSSKGSVNEAVNSVSRRLDYILQCVRNHGVTDENTLTNNVLHREDDNCIMNTEVTVTFSDFTKMVQACSTLLEKLDKGVIIGLPRYFHSPELLSQLRRRVCASAVENAKHKAGDISQLFGQKLGSPRLVVEEEIQEIQTEIEQRTSTNLPQIPSVRALSRVSVTFELKD